MGGNVEDNHSLPFSLTKIFEEVCHVYMAMGMTYDEFWNQDPKLAKYYRDAYEYKQRQENVMMWYQGQYFASAIMATVGNMFSKQHIDYVSEPFPITERELAEKKALAEQKKMERDKARFMALALKLNANMGKEVK